VVAEPAQRGPTRAAIVIDQVAPNFPVRAKRLAISKGVVTIEYTIDKSGSVQRAAVVSAEPKRVFEDAALTAIRQWKYQPKLVNGVPTEARQRFTFRFQ
jgi:protein TonB